MADKNRTFRKDIQKYDVDTSSTVYILNTSRFIIISISHVSLHRMLCDVMRWAS